MSAHFQGSAVEQYLTHLGVSIMCDDSTGCIEMDGYFATEADAMIDIVCEVDLN